MDAYPGASAALAADDALRQELYWAPPAIPTSTTLVRRGETPGSALAARWSALAGAMRWDYTHLYPPAEPLINTGSGPKRVFKRIIWRATRPLSRRYDRIAADLAELGFATAQGLALMRYGPSAGSTSPPLPGIDVPGGTGRSDPPDRVSGLEMQVAALRAELRALRGDDPAGPGAAS